MRQTDPFNERYEARLQLASQMCSNRAERWKFDAEESKVS
ncbi:predicted protein [Botrytis cinerea T4]|uniref:Uncharacterized protein n=1 Tax=Botryotinia fuckeliana (strain T4) TaxID=999810 RepID=G2Y8I9_BOTF4|nr:predicted protein [Botrytis cinerea T4]